MTDEKEPRTCKNCACHSIEKHHITNNETQMFCRRNTVLAQPARLERPRMNPLTKTIDVDRHSKKPIMETYMDLVYLYNPTLPDLTCFDGWRPMGTQPGDMSYKSTDLEKLYADAMAKLTADIQLQRDGVIDPKAN